MATRRTESSGRAQKADSSRSWNTGGKAPRKTPAQRRILEIEGAVGKQMIEQMPQMKQKSMMMPVPATERKAETKTSKPVSLPDRTRSASSARDAGYYFRRDRK